MGPQAAGLVLSVLVLTTFGHEVGNRQKAAPLPKRVRQLGGDRPVPVTAPVVIKPVWEDADNGPIQDGRPNLRLLTNAASNLVGFWNETANLGVIFDVNGGYVGLFDGGTGGAIVINLQNKVGTYIRASPAVYCWVSRSQPFVNYFNGLGSLKTIYEYGLQNGERFEKGRISYEIAHHLQVTVNVVSRGEYSATLRKALSSIIFKSRILVGTFRGPLKGLLNILGTRVTTVSLSLRTFATRFKTLGEIASKFQNGIDVLAKARLNWNVIFNEPSPIQLFIHIFSRLRTLNVDFCDVLCDYASNFKLFLVALAGNSTRGITGVLKVIDNVKGLIYGQSSINELIPVAVEYFRNSGDNPSNLQHFKKESQDILAFIEKNDFASDVASSVRFFQGVLNNNHVVKGVNVFEILKLLYEQRAAPLHNLVRVLTEIRGIVNLEDSVGLLLYYLTQLTVDGSIGDVQALIPSLKIANPVKILGYIFREAKLSSLQRNLFKFLLGRPVFGDIVSIIDSSWATYDYITLEEIFGSPDFRRYGLAIADLLTRVILAVNGGGQADNKVVVSTGIERQLKQPHNRLQSHKGPGTRHLDPGNKHSTQNHLTKHLKKHGKGRNQRGHTNKKHRGNHKMLHHDMGKHYKKHHATGQHQGKHHDGAKHPEKQHNKVAKHSEKHHTQHPGAGKHQGQPHEVGKHPEKQHHKESKHHTQHHEGGKQRLQHHEIGKHIGKHHIARNEGAKHPEKQQVQHHEGGKRSEKQHHKVGEKHHAQHSEAGKHHGKHQGQHQEVGKHSEKQHHDESKHAEKHHTQHSEAGKHQGKHQGQHQEVGKHPEKQHHKEFKHAEKQHHKESKHAEKHHTQHHETGKQHLQHHEIGKHNGKHKGKHHEAGKHSEKQHGKHHERGNHSEKPHLEVAKHAKKQHTQHHEGGKQHQQHQEVEKHNEKDHQRLHNGEKHHVQQHEAGKHHEKPHTHHAGKQHTETQHVQQHGKHVQKHEVSKDDKKHHTQHHEGKKHPEKQEHSKKQNINHHDAEKHSESQSHKKYRQHHNIKEHLQRYKHDKHKQNNGKHHSQNSHEYKHKHMEHGGDENNKLEKYLI